MGFGPRHCQPLYGLTYPNVTLGEYGLVDDDTARSMRRSAVPMYGIY